MNKQKQKQSIVFISLQNALFCFCTNTTL